MDSNEIADRIRDLMTCDDAGHAEALRLAIEGVEVYPYSAELWCLRGDALQMVTDVTQSSLPPEALACYDMALSIDPCNIEALNAKGSFLDAALNDYKLAEQVYNQAIALGGTDDSYIGLARVLAQMKRKNEAIQLLSTAMQLFPSSYEVIKIKKEIEAGIWG